MRHLAVTAKALAPRRSSEAREPLVARRGSYLGALGTALLLLTAACSTEGSKNVACSGAAVMDNMFGVGASQERANDCSGAANQSATNQSAANRGKGVSTNRGTAAPGSVRADRSTVADLQQRLNGLGYDAGPADGLVGSKTRAAIRSYQKNAGLTPDGRVTSGLMEQIRAESPG